MEEISIVEVKPQTVLGMRKRGAYKEIAIMLPKIAEYAIKNDIQITGHPLFVCHEKTPEEVMEADKAGNADVEVAFPVSKAVEGTEDIKSYELPGGKMAKIIHKGPYEDCGPTYEKLYRWLAENQMKITGPIREAYPNDPREVPTEEILTEIYAPIE